MWGSRCRIVLRFVALGFVCTDIVFATLLSPSGRRPRAPRISFHSAAPSVANVSGMDLNGTNGSAAAVAAAAGVGYLDTVDSAAVAAAMENFDTSDAFQNNSEAKQVLNDWASCTLAEKDMVAPAANFMSSNPPFADPVDKDYAPAKMSITKADQAKLKQRMWMLDTIVKLLRKHRVDYWLECGTLLGSYRHRGFIPWDDDIDLSVPISAQKRVLGAVKTEAASRGIIIHQLYFPPGNSVYQPAVAYIQRHAPRVANTHAFDATLGTLGYFVQAHYKGLKLDLWQAFPVVLDNMVLYSNGASGATLFSRHDVYPLKPCTFEGKVYNCPARSHRYLVGIYNDIALAEDWRAWWSQPYCIWDIVKVYDKKKVRHYGMEDPNFAMMTYEPTGEVHIVMPEHLKSQADTLENYKTASALGKADAVLMEQPSGYGLLSSQLMPR